MVWDWDRGGRGCIVGCSGDIGLVVGVQRLLSREARGSCICFGSVSLGFYCELSFFIVRSWCLISYRVHLCFSFALIICSWILSLITPLFIGINTLYSQRKLRKSCMISLFTGIYISFVHPTKSSFIQYYSIILSYSLSL